MTLMLRNAVALMALSACSLVTSFDGYDTEARPQLYTVSGTVDGVQSGNVALQLNGAYDVSASNGPFAFPRVLISGAGYVVTAQSGSPTESCAVVSATGTIANANVTDVAVHCASNDATLIGLALSAGPLAPAFDPSTHAYAAGGFKAAPVFFPATTMLVTATTSSPTATLTVGGAPAFSGSPTSVAIDVGTHTLHIGVTAADGTKGADYVIDVTAYASHYIKASNTRAGAWFGGPFNRFDSNASRGRAIAIDGDTLVVGSPLESSDASIANGGTQSDTSTPGAGAVYVFVRSGDTWTQQAYIKSFYPCATYAFRYGGVCDTGTAPHFGSAVAISGDTLVIGAPDQPSNYAISAGAVFVFARSGSTWTLKNSITAPDLHDTYYDLPGAAMGFGLSLAIDGDTLAVGAPYEASSATGINGNASDASAPSAGAVYVFASNGSSFVPQTYIKASNTSASAFFGSDIALHSGTLAVGAPGAGSVYVFSSNGTTWLQQALITPSSADTSFGGSVALSSAGDTLATQSGSGAFVFQRATSTWTQQIDLPLASAESVSLSPAGDQLAVGVSADASNATAIDGNASDTSMPSSGAVHVFRNSGGAWFEQAYVKASNTRQGALFGRSIELSATTLVVSSPNEASAATGVDGDETINLTPGAGAVYVY